MNSVYESMSIMKDSISAELHFIITKLGLHKELMHCLAFVVKCHKSSGNFHNDAESSMLGAYKILHLIQDWKSVWA